MSIFGLVPFMIVTFSNRHSTMCLSATKTKHLSSSNNPFNTLFYNPSSSYSDRLMFMLYTYILCHASVVHVHLAVASNEADISLHFGSAATSVILANVSAWS